MAYLMALVLSACVLLVGCTRIYSYSKAGSDAVDFKRDSDACTQDDPQMSRTASGGNPVAVSASEAKRQAHLYHKCMKARGWTAEAPQ